MIEGITPPEDYKPIGDALMQCFTITDKQTKEKIESGYMIVPLIKKENPTKEDLDAVRKALTEVIGVISDHQDPMKGKE